MKAMSEQGGGHIIWRLGGERRSANTGTTIFYEELYANTGKKRNEGGLSNSNFYTNNTISNIDERASDTANSTNNTNTTTTTSANGNRSGSGTTVSVAAGVISNNGSSPNTSSSRARTTSGDTPTATGNTNNNGLSSPSAPTTTAAAPAATNTPATTTPSVTATPPAETNKRFSLKNIRNSISSFCDGNRRIIISHICSVTC